ncbi:TMEM33 [Lepeophtheirus salmonis]|uniref:TMEM33 n=1 Tax=Lepeophtheirus salmonis TaxID=72036 RepID=A0A7R8CDT0_LEPSM|nr:TMEM33 [Lepeophtheirus salmonis]CAF2783730.1 TMEM33 [Lepeophtheirus salmonis]
MDLLLRPMGNSSSCELLAPSAILSERTSSSQLEFKFDRNTPTPPAGGITGVLRHINAQKIEAGLWATRLLTVVYTFNYVFPMFGGHPASYFGKALLANAATSALRLHQRVSTVSLSWRTLLGTLYAEDSAHYLGYSLIFYFGCLETISLVLVPIVMFAGLHAVSYTLTLLDCLNPGPMWIKKKLLVEMVKNYSSQILRSFYLLHIHTLNFWDVATPSRRNPYSKTMFQELRLFLEMSAGSDKVPAALRSLIYKAINIVSGMENMENYKKVRSETEEETWDSFGIHWLKGDNEHIPIFYITEEIEQIQLLNELTDHFYERGFVALSGYGSLIPRVISTVESLKNQSILEGCQVNPYLCKKMRGLLGLFFQG